MTEVSCSSYVLDLFFGKALYSTTIFHDTVITYFRLFGFLFFMQLQGCNYKMSSFYLQNRRRPQFTFYDVLTTSCKRELAVVPTSFENHHILQFSSHFSYNRFSY